MSASNSVCVQAEHRLNYVNGDWRPAESQQTRLNVNPADFSDDLGEFVESGGADADRAVGAAMLAQADWQDIGPVERARYLRAAGRLLGERSERIAGAITREQGKLLDEARGEVAQAGAILEFTAGEASHLSGTSTSAEDNRTWAMKFRRPIGVVGLISPWNFPLAIPMGKVAPALLSGCTAVLKPSPYTPLTSALLIDLFHDVGLPAGVLNLIQGDVAAGEALVANPQVAGISFTGSYAVGAAIHSRGAHRILRTRLEVGGKNAVIILDDADLSRAVDAVVSGAFGQAGQRCSATSRVIVDGRIKREFLNLLVPRVAGLRVGAGFDPAAQIGPVVDENRMHACLRAVAKAREDGAEVLTGGFRITEGLPEGCYVAPTILTDVAWDSELAHEEGVGPVLSVIEADGFDDALRIANSVRYGRSETVFTQSPARMYDAVERLEAGMLHINRSGVDAYAHLPHVGTKTSQYGSRECSPQVWDFYTEWRSACLSF
ncbi:aldehyde dehydrogenase family protein [Streptomyces sp. NPDC015139]|uniref:aldehyde dehydrogenase family protein n=1 Tax=Streptomyces sp. NPDC015139 TaxID=3364942 RepID=UPI0036F56814